MTILWENERNGELGAGAGAHSRSLGFTRDDKGEGGASMGNWLVAETTVR
jgi:hypothetical protein